MTTIAASADDEKFPWNVRKDSPTPRDPLAGITARYEETVNGKKRDLYTIGALAKIIGRKPDTVRGWENFGWLPQPTDNYTGRDPKNPASARHGRRRLYTRDQIIGIYMIAKDEGILEKHAKPITHTNFTKRVIKLFQDLAARDQQMGGGQ
ncbi:hypothetical protein [Nonomuraea typhae]|uniref:MerR family transcriptional regulator n=1 Tax=Nonomuraea typhae TaxID=2603600 RepID=A0ABW7YJ56_9ACTN